MMALTPSIACEVVDDVVAAMLIRQLLFYPIGYQGTLSKPAGTCDNHLMPFPVPHPFIKHLKVSVITDVVLT